METGLYYLSNKKKNQVVSLSHLKDEVVNIFCVPPNYWPYCQMTVPQHEYCCCLIPLYNAYSIIPWKCVFIFFIHKPLLSVYTGHSNLEWETPV